MGIFLTVRDFNVVVKVTCQMVACITCFSETAFINAVTAFPSRQFGAVIGMRAAMVHVIGFAFVCKEMFCVFALGVRGLSLIARSGFGIALGISFACINDFPFARNAFGKCVVVTLPGVIGAFGVGVTRFCLGITLRTSFAYIDDFPLFGNTFEKRVSVAFPCVVGASVFTVGYVRIFSACADQQCA